MEYRDVGRSGLQVSVAGLGCNNFGMRIDKEQTAAVVHRALELGVTLFDTADIYGGTRSEEFLGAALGDLVRQGKVRYIGCSNFAAWQMVEAQWTARTEHFVPLISAQSEYNLLNRRIERELVPACQQFGLGILPYFPLASGFLSGKYR